QSRSLTLRMPQVCRTIKIYDRTVKVFLCIRNWNYGNLAASNGFKVPWRLGCWCSRCLIDWLSGLDSNQDKGLQRALCYRYTTGQNRHKLPSAFHCRKEKLCRCNRRRGLDRLLRHWSFTSGQGSLILRLTLTALDFRHS